MRYLILILAIFLLVYIARMLLSSRAKHRTVQEQPQPRPRRRVSNMVRCEQCGLHLPEKEAIRRHGHSFCSREHAKEWLEQQQDD